VNGRPALKKKRKKGGEDARRPVASLGWSMGGKEKKLFAAPQFFYAVGGGGGGEPTSFFLRSWGEGGEKKISWEEGREKGKREPGALESSAFLRLREEKKKSGKTRTTG